MRVLITTDWYEPVINGVVTSVMNLSRQLRERGHEVKILTLSRTFHSYIEGDVVYAGSIGLGCIYPQARLKIPKAAGVLSGGSYSIWKNISYVKKKTGVKKSVCSLVYRRMHWCWYM